HEEDAKLIQVLLDMVNLGLYKVENVFKPGYLNYVEDKMKVCLPNSGLKAKSHIESRIKTLKNDLHIVYDMLNGSNTIGFGFDPIKNYITVEKVGNETNVEGPDNMMENIENEETNKGEIQFAPLYYRHFHIYPL
ncbi:hypothetical protein MIMGU_mgv1a023849mg, partial [Erythranthe guttata]